VPYGPDDGTLAPWAVVASLPFAPEIVLMIENYRTGLLWQWMRHCPYLITGLRRAGFSYGSVNCARILVMVSL